MSFLTPAFLLGALAVAIPILVHLTNREKKDVVDFPSLMFLRRSPIARCGGRGFGTCSSSPSAAWLSCWWRSLSPVRSSRLGRAPPLPRSAPARSSISSTTPTAWATRIGWSRPRTRFARRCARSAPTKGPRWSCSRTGPRSWTSRLPTRRSSRPWSTESRSRLGRRDSVPRSSWPRRSWTSLPWPERKSCSFPTSSDWASSRRTTTRGFPPAPVSLPST